MKLGSSLAVILLLLVTALHVLRLAFGVPVTAGGVIVPMWASAVGALVTAALAVMLWREVRQ